MEATTPGAERRLCQIVFPVGRSRCALIIGEENGTGLERLDGKSYDENPTTRPFRPQQGKWHQVRLRVTEARVEAWIDGSKLFDQPIVGHKLSTRACYDQVRPFGICRSWEGSTLVRRIGLRQVESKAGKATTVKVPGDARWLDSGLVLARGRRYEFSATGRWGYEPERGSGPEGWADPGAKDFTLPGAPKFCLLGRIGETGKPFVIGDHLVLTTEQSGRLYLQMNDSDPGNNWGSVTLTVRALGKEPRAPTRSSPAGEDWQSLFDGKSLRGWRTVKLPQASSGKARVEDNRIILDMVPGLGTALEWVGDFPAENYEVEFQASKLAGEYLCNVIFPIGASRCSLNLGDNTGFDTLDGLRSWENTSTTRLSIRPRRWYRCRLRVTESAIEVWVEGKKIINLPRAGHKFTVYPVWAPVKSLALCTWNTGAALRNIRLRRLGE
jgi:hypothetical protein